MMRIGDLLGLEVRTRDGVRLGHVFDLRSDGAPGRGEAARETRDVSGLVYGHFGFLERLGIRQARARIIPWSAVVAVKDGCVVVPAPGDEQARPQHRRERKRKR